MLEVQRDPFRRGLEVRLGAVGEGEGEAVAEEQGADAAALVGGVDGEVEEVCFWVSGRVTWWMNGWGGWRTDAQESLLSSTHFSARWSSCPKKASSSAVFQPSGLGGGGGGFLSFSAAFCSAVSGVWGNCQRDRASISLDCKY